MVCRHQPSCSYAQSGMAGAFAQTVSAQALRRVVLDRKEMPEVDRQVFLFLLSGEQHSGCEPKSGEVIGISKEGGSTMKRHLDDAAVIVHAAVKSKGDCIQGNCMFSCVF